MARQLLFLLIAVLLIRLPFLNQATQGDDVYYLAGAQYAQTDPFHPSHARYLFVGQEVTMQGHPHPPLNVWFLAGLLALVGDIREVPFHAAYILFSLLAALSMWSLARRFSPRPLLATLLFLVTPAFVVNGNSFEADVPFLAFWMASAALFVAAVDAGSPGRLAWAATAMAVAALAAYQSMLLAPILAVYLWMKRRRWAPGWLALAAAPGVLVLWQFYERVSSGVAPVSVVTGYFQSYALQTFKAKGLNAAALTGHAAWLIFPLLMILAFKPARRGFWLIAAALALCGAFLDWNPLYWASAGIGVLLFLWCGSRLGRKQDSDTRFLALWVLIFFAAALAIFFAGSMRYLLPMAAPVALLATRVLSGRPAWLAAGVALQMLLSLGLSVENYQHWDGYRRFAASFRKETETRRVWINGEWGLRYYFETDGGLPVRQGQGVQPEEMVVTSDLSFPIPLSTGGGAMVPVSELEIRSWLPFRLIGLGTRSGYSSVSFGVRPFDLATGPIDRVHASLVVERKPSLSYLEMSAPDAEHQIVSGIYELEEGRWRWMSAKAVLLLKPPEAASVVEVALYIPDSAPARRVSVSLDGVPVVEKTIASPGPYTLTSGPVAVASEAPALTISVNQTFSAPGDQRQLGIVLMGAGFKPAK